MKDWAGWTASVVVTAVLFAGAAAAALRQAPGVTAGDEPVAVAMTLSVGLISAPPPAVAAAQSPEPPAPPPEPAPEQRPRSTSEPVPAMEPSAPQALPAPDRTEALPQVDTAAPVTPLAVKEPPKEQPAPKPLPKKQAKLDKSAPQEPSHSAGKDQPKERQEKPVKAAAAAPSGDAANPAQPAADRKKAGGIDAASYARTVLKKIARLSRKAAPGKGRASVGFVIAANGSLLQVVILSSSGVAALDKIALDHIRRAAPFPAPPQGAQSSFSFEFVAK